MFYQTIRIAFLDDKAKNDDDLPAVSAVFHNVDFYKDGGTLFIQKKGTSLPRDGIEVILGIKEDRIVSFVVSNPREEKEKKND